MLKYQAELLKLSRSLLRTFALGLGAEENYFDPIVTAPFVSIILQHYAPRDPQAEDLDGLGAHSDFESKSTPNVSMFNQPADLKNSIHYLEPRHDRRPRDSEQERNLHSSETDSWNICRQRG